jgi:MFS superfamily sulfate permease-like transporter
VVVYRVSNLLFFANCGVFRNRAEELVDTAPEPLHGFILDASAIVQVDLEKDDHDGIIQGTLCRLCRR